MDERLDDHPLRPYPKLLVNCALTGMVPTKDDTPHVPVTPEEIARDAKLCIEAGATMLHVHARDQDGKPTYRKEIYEDIIGRIRDLDPRVIICASTSGRLFREPELRGEVLQLKGRHRPDMASLTLGSFNFPRAIVALASPGKKAGDSVDPSFSISPNPPETIMQLARMMSERGIKPELEVFEAGMINYGIYLMRKDILPGDRPYFNLILGSLGAARASMASLSHMVDNLPTGAIWAAAGTGRFQLPINVAAIVMGGGVRVGVEDCIYYDYGKKVLATNAKLVERLTRIAGEIGREIATAEEAREMLGLP
jgi:3-keto-5-aminohexanoate cleavage enzyme